MPPRFAFRQIDYRDIPTILIDGEVRSKTHPAPQALHQTSYPNLVSMRGGPAFDLPYGGVVNDYVAFYFSPVTAFTHTIHRGNVEVVSPQGQSLGQSSLDERVFLVVNVQDAFEAQLPACFSDAALNSYAPMPTVIADPQGLATHVRWPLFDEEPLTAQIPEIGYTGACKYFFNRDVPTHHQTRAQHRMAEFLVRERLPLGFVSCIIVPNEDVRRQVQWHANFHGFRGPVLLKRGCFV